MTATRPQSTEGTGESPTASAGRNSQATTSDELFSAAQRHLAHHHPQLLGALGPGMVSQMAEDVGGQ